MRSPEKDLQNAINAFNTICDESHPLCFQWAKILRTIEQLQAQVDAVRQCLSAAKDTYNHPSANAVINAIQDIIEDKA